MKLYSTYSSPVGSLTIIAENGFISELSIVNQKYLSPKQLENAIKADGDPLILKTKSWLDSYFKGEKPDSSELPLKPVGNHFRQLVWAELLKIPYGQTTNYGEIAKVVAIKMNKEKMSAQAVGGAIGHNPIGIIIPCHRVIGKNGQLTGYAGGLKVKEYLLKLETQSTFTKKNRNM